MTGSGERSTPTGTIRALEFYSGIGGWSYSLSQALARDPRGIVGQVR